MPKITKIGCADMGMKDACTQNNVFEKRYWHLTKKKKLCKGFFYLSTVHTHVFWTSTKQQSEFFMLLYCWLQKKKLNILESLRLHVDIVWELSDIFSCGNVWNGSHVKILGKTSLPGFYSIFFTHSVSRDTYNVDKSLWTHLQTGNKTTRQCSSYIVML